MRREISGDVFSAQWKTLLGLRLIQGEVLTFGGGNKIVQPRHWGAC